MARENAEWLARKQLTARSASTIKVRYADFTTVTRSHTLSLPTSDADVIASWADDAAGEDRSRPPPGAPARRRRARPSRRTGCRCACGSTLRRGSISRGDSAAPLLIAVPTGCAAIASSGAGASRPSSPPSQRA